MRSQRSAGQCRRRPDSGDSDRGEPSVDGNGDGGRTCGASERIHYVQQRLRSWCDEMKCSPVDFRQVHQHIHRHCDEVDRDDVGVTEIRTDQRQPGR